MVELDVPALNLASAKWHDVYSRAFSDDPLALKGAIAGLREALDLLDNSIICPVQDVGLTGGGL
jgi:hypothetical protein